MDIISTRDYCLSKKHVTEDTPFDEHTVVFRIAGKMFALMSLIREPSQINLKCDPEYAVELRLSHPHNILPGFHMNKKHWNSVLLEQGLKDKLIKDLIDHSFELVYKSLTKKQKDSLKLEDIN